MKRSHEINMTEGAILPKLLQFSMPILLMSILQNLFNAADVVIVGKFSSSKAMAAVGSTTSLIGFLVSLFSGVASGTNILCARYFGKGDPKKLTACLHTSVLLAVLLSLPVAVLGIVFSRLLLRMVNIDPLVMDMAALYLQLYFLGITADMVFNFAAAGVRATGNSRLPTIYLTVAGLTNLALNCVFVIGFGMDVDGVAYATVFSKYLSMFLLLRFMFRTQDSCKLSWKQMRLHHGYVLPLLQLGIPAGISGSLNNFANMTMQSSINAFGYMTTAGNAAANSIMNFAYSSFGAVSSAVSCFTSQNVGAGKYKRVPQLLKRSMTLCVLLSACFSCAFYFFGVELLSLFVSANDPNRDAIIAQGMVKLMTVGVPIYCYGIFSAQSGVLGGFGRTFLSMLISITSVFGFRISWVKFVVPVLPHEVKYVYLCLPLGMLLSSVMYAIAIAVVYRKYSRQMSERLPNPT